jgi:hypothetical protein
VAHVFCEHGSPIDKLAYDLKSKAPAEQQGVLFHVWSNDLANYGHKSLLIGSTWITSGLPTNCSENGQSSE